MNLARKDLARGLDISEVMVSRLVARGMPEGSVADAERWRRQHLNIARTKRGRRVQMRPDGELVAAAMQMLELAGQALDDGNGAAFDALVPACRAALSAVPEHARAAVRLRFDVLDRLCAPLPEMLREALAEDAAAGEPEPPMSEAAAVTMGRFWYAIAAGERAEVPTPESAGQPWPT